jgi:hypothetical protein
VAGVTSPSGAPWSTAHNPARALRRRELKAPGQASHRLGESNGTFLQEFDRARTRRVQPHTLSSALYSAQDRSEPAPMTESPHGTRRGPGPRGGSRPRPRRPPRRGAHVPVSGTVTGRGPWDASAPPFKFATGSSLSVTLKIGEYVHAEDDTHWHWQRPVRCDTGFRVLNPAYQNPDRRGRAEDTRGYRDDRGWKGLTILSSSPFEQEFLLRGVAPKSREFTSNK